MKKIPSLEKEIVKVERELENIKKAVAAGIITDTTKKMLENAQAKDGNLLKG